MCEVLVPEICVMPAAMAADLGPWSYCSSAPGTITHPDQLDSASTEWRSAVVPGTIASALAAANQWDMQQPPKIDEFDWWYRTTLARPDCDLLTESCWLSFAGLATLAEIWLNGTLVLRTDNMFREHQLDLSESLIDENELVIGFRSVTADLQTKRPRPRWKTNLVNHQQLRWQRTTLLGRIPGWSPPVPVIGPWRKIELERATLKLSDMRLTTSLDGETGIVSVTAQLQTKSSIDRVLLKVGNHTGSLEVQLENGSISIRGQVFYPDAPLWWPHTHGEQAMSACQLIVESNGERHEIDCGRIGFRQLQVDRDNGFSLRLNGQPIYCRGACWTVSNVFTVDADEDTLRRDLILAKDAGANMLRVIGTMIYESDLFYQLCDELGILVWQDFMFANMDYPVDDPGFGQNVQAEAIGQLRRLASHPSVVIYCGNSEVEQQAAMLGMPRDVWRNAWFAETLPKLCAEYHPGTEYVASTPSGGVLPFHPNSGISHFYGVGAYLRSPAELRQTNVKFTPECLGFSNVPEPDTVDAITGGMLPIAHHPRWKQRVPRDTGAGWDFEDVRDHYLKQVYGLDPILLRSTDMPRYLELSRVVSGEMMAQTYSEWRGGHSQNRGALVWFFKDPWPAAGWGIIDHSSQPKAAYYFLKRSWNCRQITITDEGLNGLHLHVINEHAQPFSGFVELTLLKEPNVVVARKEIAIETAGRGRSLLSADELLGGFYDVSYAYRFGAPHHDVVIATLLGQDRQVIGEAFHFVRRRESCIAPAIIEADAQATSDSTCQLTLRSDRFLHNVRLTANGFLPDDNYFHMCPRRTKVVSFSAHQTLSQKFRVEVEALNLENPLTVSLTKNRG